MLRLRWGTLGFGLALLLVVGGLAFYFWRDATEEEVLPPALVLASPAPAPDFSVVLIEEADVVRRVLHCSPQRCTPQLLPGSIEGDSVFDGEGWLYYQEAVSTVSKLTKKILTRVVVATNDTAQLIEATPLTSPRDLIISPTGKHTAFFLDNIDRPEEELTELWLYDREKNGVRLVAEKLYRPDIRSHVRWNRSGTALWFLADTGAQEDPEDVLAVVVVPVTGPVSTPWQQVAWDEMTEVIDHGVMDISSSGKAIAYAAPTFFGKEELRIVNTERPPQRLSAKGTIVYIQFLEDDALVYGVQDARGVTFWKLQDAVVRYIARQPGQLRSAQGNPAGEFILMAMQSQARGPVTLHLLHAPTGTVTAHATVSGQRDTLALTQLTIRPKGEETVIRGAGDEPLTDAETAAFLDQNLATIAGNEGIAAKRFLTTDQPNTVYVDYAARTGPEKRLLVVIHDVTHADWSIKGRYEAAQAEWHKTQGGGLPDPKPVRLYEWEETVGQWILKQDIRN